MEPNKEKNSTAASAQEGIPRASETGETGETGELGEDNLLLLVLV